MVSSGRRAFSLLLEGPARNNASWTWGQGAWVPLFLSQAL